MKAKWWSIVWMFWLMSWSAEAMVWNICAECKIKSPEEGLALASPHDTLLFAPGIYACQNFTITKPIVLIGADGAQLDGRKKEYIIKILSDSVIISNLHLINSGRSYTHDFAAVYAFKSKNFRIENVKVERSFFGFLLEKCGFAQIQGNTIVGTAKREDESGNGIHLWHCDQMEISENEVYGMRDGIYLEFVDDSHVHHNYSHNNVRYGLHFMFSNRDQYAENTFVSNGAGVAVMFSKFIKMEKNQFLKNWGTSSYGLLLKEIYDGEVISNQFEENTLAIFIDGSTRINYQKNTFKQNGWAIKVSGGCYQNRFLFNNFISNSFDVSYNSKLNDNLFENNYWSEYSGYDINRDGVGDVPYRPVKLFSYVVNNTPETIILLRSLFVDIINFSERVSPVFTPDDLQDLSPSLKIFQ